MSKLLNKSSIGLTIIILLTIGIYSTSIQNDFSNFDDPVYVIKNDCIKDLSTHGLAKIFTEDYGYYMPLTYLTWAVQYKLVALSPTVFHLTNLLLHLINVILTFQLILLITKRRESAFIVALLFAIHPLHVESVAWITETKDVLYSVFYLSALVYYVKYLTQRTKKFYWYTMVFFLLSLLSKPTAITLPVVLLLIDYLYQRKLLSKPIIKEKIPFFGLSIVFGLITILFVKKIDAFADLSPFFSGTERFFMWCYSLWFYLEKMIIPINLCAVHLYVRASKDTLPIIYYLSPLLLIIILTSILFVLKQFKENKQLKREIWFGLLFFGVNIFMFLNIVPASNTIVAERYTYIAYIGFFFIAGQLYCYLADKQKMFKPFLIILISIFSIWFSITTYQRNKIWENGITLFTDVIQKYPHHSYGYYIRALEKHNNKDYLAAISDMDTAISLDKKQSLFYNYRAISKTEIKDYKGALQDFSTVIRLEPNDPEIYVIYNKRGKVKSDMGNIQGALEDWNKAIDLKPNYAEALNNRGSAKYTLTNYMSALEDYNLSIAIHPDAQTYYNRGNTKFQIKDLKGAINDFSQAIQLQPKYPAAYYNRGIAKFQSGDKSGACADWKQANQLGHPNAATLLRQYCI